MEGRLLARYFTGAIPLAVLSVLVSAALFMVSAATQNSPYFTGFYSLLLALSIVGIALLLLLIAFNLRQLVRQFRAGALGSRLTVRLLAIFSLLAFVPVAVVYVFSLQLLNRGVDSWFDIKIERALNDALALGRSALGALQEDVTHKMREIAADYESRRGDERIVLNQLREQYALSDLALFDPDGQVIAASNRHLLTDAKTLVPQRPQESVLNRVRKGETYSNLEGAGEGLRLRVVTPVYRRGSSVPARILQTLQPLDTRYSQLGESVQDAFAEYEKLVYLRKPLKYGFTLTLTLVALLTLLISLWTAIFLARRLVAPLRNLAAGTRAVADGNYRKRIPVPSNDEFGVLVKSFNDMTRKIQHAQNQTKRSQREAEAQRTYLETVLAHLSSGVLSFDPGRHLRMHNASAAHVLGADLVSYEGREIATIGAAYPHLSGFMDTIAAAMRDGRSEWQTEHTLMGPQGRRVIIARGTLLPGLDVRRGGCVVVFDDATNLIQAQRDAAWGEVARRLAHEIKNPLTPIQLSAERIRHKCMGELSAPQREMLERATGTIIQQVDAMKSMVNEFADYARPQQLQFEPVNLNTLVRDVVELYRGRHENIDVQLQLDDDFPSVRAEPRRLRQVLHNLLLNATDAVAHASAPALRIKTSCVRDAKCQFVELQVGDNGTGFGVDLLDRVFEPYVTSKEKGTGLGLAIVKKIVEEHGGMVWAENLAVGASITVRLPTRAEPSAATLERA